MKDEFGRVIVDEFVGLKSKMDSIKNIDGKESNTPKGVNIATKFEEFKNTLFNKKIMRHKDKEIQKSCDKKEGIKKVCDKKEEIKKDCEKTSC